MNKTVLNEQKEFIKTKFNEDAIKNTDFGFLTDENIITSKVSDENRHFKGYVTSWIENNSVRHHFEPKTI